MKTYFIGLGGCGLKTVSLLQKKFKSAGIEDDFAFTYIDTDEKTRDLINNTEHIISSTDFLNLGNTNPYAIYRQAKDKQNRDADDTRLLEWVISQEEPDHMVLPNHPISDGAQAMRQIGRTAFYHNYDYIHDELEKKIGGFEEINNNEGNTTKDVDIWVVASSCGGTGSSNLLDLLYLIDKLASTVVSDGGEPNLKLVLFMPQPFIEKNNGNPNYPLNAYSCLWEINAFRNAYDKNNKLTFENFAVKPSKLGETVPVFPLFKYVIPVDVETADGSKLNVDTNLYPTIAEMIYYMNIGNGAKKLCSDLCNDIAHLAPTKDGQMRKMVGYGFRAIKKANQELREYMVKRGIYELLNYGLLGDLSRNDIEDDKIKFANEIILSRLINIGSCQYNEGNITYDFKSYTIDSDSLETRITKIINNKTRIVPDDLNKEVLRTKIQQLDAFSGAYELSAIRDEIFNNIKSSIDSEINKLIINNGLTYTFNLISKADDFYLEPLNRYIKATLLPAINESIKRSKTSCNDYLTKSIWFGIKAEVGQALQTYRDSIIRQICLTIASDIINKLTADKIGYLELLRKGDRKDTTGIRPIKDEIAQEKDRSMNAYSDLAESFRKTRDNIMTVFLPNLYEIATGPNNSDWKPYNFFDQLYQGSILEQETIDNGIREIDVPIRTSQKNLGLTDFLKRISDDDNFFINIIKDSPVNLKINVKRLIDRIISIVTKEATNTQTIAGKWMQKELKDEIHNPALLSDNSYKSVEYLFDDFKDSSRIPVFFPLANGKQFPITMRLIYVGSDINLARELGYNDKGMAYVQDDNMKDRFMIMRMPSGLSFDMYKYYQPYKQFYETPEFNNMVRRKSFGCHIHQVFNECTNLKEAISRARLGKFVKCLYLQYVVEMLKSESPLNYNMIFDSKEANNQEAAIVAGVKGLQNKIKIPESSLSSNNSKCETFISITPDYENETIKLVYSPLLQDTETHKLIVDRNNTTSEKFTGDQIYHLENFIDSLLKIDERAFSAASLIEEALSRIGISGQIKDRAAKRLTELDKDDENNPIYNFALCLYVWEHCNNNEPYQGDVPYIKQIHEIIKSLN